MTVLHQIFLLHLYESREKIRNFMRVVCSHAFFQFVNDNWIFPTYLYILSHVLSNCHATGLKAFELKKWENKCRNSNNLYVTWNHVEPLSIGNGFRQAFAWNEPESIDNIVIKYENKLIIRFFTPLFPWHVYNLWTVCWFHAVACKQTGNCELDFFALCRNLIEVNWKADVMNLIHLPI